RAGNGQAANADLDLAGAAGRGAGVPRVGVAVEAQAGVGGHAEAADAAAAAGQAEVSRKHLHAAGVVEGDARDRGGAAGRLGEAPLVGEGGAGAAAEGQRPVGLHVEAGTR